jgi:uncharacterized protein YecE (DUF72 family)
VFGLAIQALAGDFYPAEVQQSEWFSVYANSFDTVEVNNSLYRLPAPATFTLWREQAPRQFLYSVKASRFLICSTNGPSGSPYK